MTPDASRVGRRAALVTIGAGLAGCLDVLEQDSDDAAVIDDFERDPLANYQGETSWFAQSSAHAAEGGASLELQSDGGAYVMYSTSGLEAYPEPGDTFQFQYLAGATGEPQQAVAWGVQGPGRYYAIEINNDPPDPILRLLKDGDELATTGQGDRTPRQEWQRVEIEWANDGLMTCSIHNSNGAPAYQVSAQDRAYRGGGVGYRAGASGRSISWVDDYRIV